jgi:type 1 glutamine amidotransferase
MAPRRRTSADTRLSSVSEGSQRSNSTDTVTTRHLPESCTILGFMQRLQRISVFLLLVAMSAGPAAPQQKKKRLLAIGDVHRKNYQHDAVSHALATIEQLGRKSGIYDTYIRTDIQLLTKHPLEFAEKSAVADANYKTLNDFDAIFFYGIGELELTAQQKADFMSFIKEDGKGFVGAHTVVTSFTTWPEYGDMVDGYFDDHPWEVTDAPVIVEAHDFPAMKGFPNNFMVHDEIYQLKNFSRDKVRVLASLDANKMDLKNPRVHRTDKDFALAWARTYGKGRVFCSVLGHTDESWDDPKMQTMWLEAIKWSMGLTQGDVRTRPKASAK